MKQKLERNISMTFRVTDKERDLIREAQKQSGIANMRAYLLKMAVNGLIIHINLDGVRKMNFLLSNATTNINQIAKRANETSSIFSADMVEIKSRQDEIWEQQRVILKSLSDIMGALQKRLPKHLADALKRKCYPAQ